MSENQSFQTRREGDSPAPDPGPAPVPSSAAAQDFSAVLNDIDDILEENALSFVQGFVQEGGQ